MNKYKKIDSYILLFILISFFFIYNNKYHSIISWYPLGVFILVRLIGFILNEKTLVKNLDRFFFYSGNFLVIVLGVLLVGFENYFSPKVLGSNLDYNSFNKMGIVFTLYLIAYNLGSNFFDTYYSSKLTSDHKSIFYKNSLSIGILAFYITLSFIPFLIYGESNFLNNFFNNLTGRQNTHVAFNDSSLGTSNPIVVLLIQILPVTIILIFTVYLKSKYRFLLMIIALLYFAMYTTLGGRSAILFVVTVILLYNLIYSKIQYKRVVLFSMFVLIITYGVLTFQARNRYQYSIESDNALSGSNLYSELLLITNTFGDSREFVSANNPFDKIFLPTFDTIVLFLTNPIPRKIWPNKPFDKSFVEYNYLRTGEYGTGVESNVTPTIPGRYFMKYGISGVLQIGLIVGFLFRLSQIQITRNIFDPLLVVLFLTLMSILFICARDLTPGRFYPFYFLLLFVILNRKFFKIR